MPDKEAGSIWDWRKNHDHSRHKTIKMSKNI